MVNIAAVTFSCTDPYDLADFWAKALDKSLPGVANSESAAVLADVPLFSAQPTSTAGPTVCADSAHLKFAATAGTRRSPSPFVTSKATSSTSSRTGTRPRRPTCADDLHAPRSARGISRPMATTSTTGGTSCPIC
jgi:hypothetical protein